MSSILLLATMTPVSPEKSHALYHLIGLLLGLFCIWLFLRVINGVLDIVAKGEDIITNSMRTGRMSSMTLHPIISKRPIQNSSITKKFNPKRPAPPRNAATANRYETHHHRPRAVRPQHPTGDFLAQPRRATCSGSPSGIRKICQGDHAVVGALRHQRAINRGGQMSAVRTITMHEGKYLHLGDMQEFLKREDFLAMFPALMKVAHDRGDSAEYIMAVILGSALLHWSGELPLPTLEEAP